MLIKSWKAEISFLVTEGTDSARGKFEVEGAGCERSALPGKVAAAIERYHALLDDEKNQAKRIAELERKLALMREAAQADIAPAQEPVAPVSPLAPPADVEAPLPPPVDDSPRKGRKVR